MQRNDIRLQTDPGSLVLVDDEEIRPRTDLSSVSDLGTVLGVILVLKRLYFSSTFMSRLLVRELRNSARLSCRDSFSVMASSSLILSFQLDQLIETP